MQAHPSQVHNNLLYRFLLQYYIAQSALHNFQVISAEVEQRFAAGLFLERRTRSLAAALAPGKNEKRSRGGRRRTSGGGERTRCLRQFSDRDWLHPALPVRPERERAREKDGEARTVPLLPYYILHNSNSERSELLRCFYCGGWMKEKRRKEAVARARRERAEEEQPCGCECAIAEDTGGKITRNRVAVRNRFELAPRCTELRENCHTNWFTWSTESGIRKEEIYSSFTKCL